MSANAAETVLVDYNSTWKFLKGNTEASSPDPTSWRNQGFADASWTTAPAPFWYGDAQPSPGTQITDMQNGYASIFLRKTFNISSKASISDLQLRTSCDDGYIAWINGREVNRYNMPSGELAANRFATGAAPEPVVLTSYPLDNFASYLVDGENTIAIQVFNSALDSSDLVFNAGLFAVMDDVAPTLASQFPFANSIVRSLQVVEVNFSESVTNIDASDLLINGSPATNVNFLSPSQMQFAFTQPPTGRVDITWAPGHGITDTSVARNPFTAVSWYYTLDPNAKTPKMVLNEFLADNGGDQRNPNVIRDDDGDPSDWIEIHNSGDTLESLDGYFLTDDPATPTKWRFPNVAIQPHGYLIVWASGKDHIDPARPLHTSFSLREKGEYLALLDPSTNVLTPYFPLFPDQKKDVSYGLVPGTITNVGYFYTPTPGKVNSSSGQGFAPDVVFSHKGGTFVGPITLSLSTPDNTNATIYYVRINTAVTSTTTNVPTELSNRYSGPITINATEQIRARAYAPGLLPGAVQTETFIQMSGTITNFTSDLPIIVIHTLGATTITGGNGTPETIATMAVYDTHLGTSALTNKADLIRRIGINPRGSSTQDLPKQSWAIEFWDEFNDDKDVELLGLPAESDWVLFAPNYFDRTGLHNPLAYKISNDMGRYASRTRFVEVFINNTGGALNANMANTGDNMGNYRGIYVLEEKIKRNSERVDIAELAPEQTNAPAITGGFILKIDRVDTDERSFTAGTVNNVYVYPDGLLMVTPQRAAQSNYIYKYINDFYTALMGTSWTNPVTGYSAYIDVDAWIDHHIINTFTINADGMRLSGYFFKDRNKKLEMGPVWDFDRALGTGDSGNTDFRAFNPRSWMGASPLGTGNDYGTDFFNATSGDRAGGGFANPWYSRLFKDNDFWQRWIDRWQELRATTFDTNNLNRMVDNFANEIRNAKVRDQARWGTKAGSDPTPRNGTITAPINAPATTPYSHTFNGTFQGEVDFQKRWFSDRVTFIDTNFLARPSFSTSPGLVSPGFSLSLSDNSAKAGTVIYYTLDGRDPRLPGGAIAPYALTYQGSINVSTNLRLFARAYNAAHKNVTGAYNPPATSPWSGSAVGSFFTELPSLRITEIMYNPAKLAGNTNDSDVFEYIELKNIGSQNLNLAGFQLTGGVDFALPNYNLAAGESCVIVSSSNLFVLRYGASLPIAGQYTGSIASNTLNNTGERLTLTGPMGEPILDFTYSDSWLPITDGFGFALAIIDDTAPVDSWNLASSWTTSPLGGTPGQANPAPANIPAVVINEIINNSVPPAVDRIELRNLTDAPVNLQGWYLTDNFGTPRKYRFGDVTIPANGYLALDETEFNGTNASVLTRFALSSSGESVYLFSGDANGNLTGYVHGFDFGTQFPGVSFGRHVISTGADHFVRQAQPTLGGANAGPGVGPVVITEIMYHPADYQVLGKFYDNTDDEFVEIRNIDGDNLPLYHPQFPTNTWRVSDAIQYTFPMGVTLPAGGYALLVNFDPAVANLANAFRARHGIAANVPLFGPYSGSLGNGSQSIEIFQPDAVATPTNFTLNYVLLERVRYSDQAPWPVAADGFGMSLQRKDPAAYGNDPANWVAAKATAGLPSVGGTLPEIAQHPATQTVIGNNDVTFNVAASGPGPFSYQWAFNGQPIQGATNASLVLPYVQTNQAGFYKAIVFNAAGAVASSNALLTVIAPVSIIQHPQDRVGKPGTNISFSVVAFSGSEITYQWRFNDVDIPGATNGVLSLNNVQSSNDGFYRVVVRDAISFAISEPARLTIQVEPVVVTHPDSQVLAYGETLNLVAGAVEDATLPLTFRWRRNNVVTTNFVYVYSREHTYSIPNATLDNSATYSVAITNIFKIGGHLSSNAFVSVVAGPTNQVVEPGASVKLVAASGNPGPRHSPIPMRYQWRFNGAPLNNPAVVSNSVSVTNTALVIVTTNSITIPAVTAAEIGNYEFVAQIVSLSTVTNRSTNVVNGTNQVITTISTNVNTIAQASFPATISFPSADTDNDGMPDEWEDANGLNKNSAADANADADGDGMSNLAEFGAGTNPKSASSYLKLLAPEVQGDGPATVVLKFGAVAGKTYSILYQTPLNPSNQWIKLKNVPAAAQDGDVTVTDTAPGAAQRYYRLVTPQQP